MNYNSSTTPSDCFTLPEFLAYLGVDLVQSTYIQVQSIIYEIKTFDDDAGLKLCPVEEAIPLSDSGISEGVLVVETAASLQRRDVAF